VRQLRDREDEDEIKEQLKRRDMATAGVVTQRRPMSGLPVQCRVSGPIVMYAARTALTVRLAMCWREACTTSKYGCLRIGSDEKPMPIDSPAHCSSGCRLPSPSVLVGRCLVRRFATAQEPAQEQEYGKRDAGQS
jgi:hypothetical protein